MRQRNYDVLPEHMREGMRKYLEEGVQPGQFLYHILINDFVHAYGYADIFNQQALHIYAVWLYNEMPTGSWGSRDSVDAWVAHRGWAGFVLAATTERGIHEAVQQTKTDEVSDGTQDTDQADV